VAIAGKALDLFAHRSGVELVLELEPAPARRRTGAEVLGDLLPVVSSIATAADVADASALAAAGVRRIAGYDRVMVYRFLEDGSGQVIAEAKSASFPAFLNHRYPASDIPQQARALYLSNPIRVIPDVAYQPAPIRGGEGQLDLSGALLRSVSPIHIQYLKNMGVGASASISLVRGNALWGLIACHHDTAKPIAHEEREMCRRFAIALEQAIGRLEDEDTSREVLKLTRRREELLPVIASAETVSAGLRDNIDELRRLLSADGIGLLLDSELVCSGVTPAAAAVRNLARWVLRESQPREPFVTDALSQLYPPAAEWTASASGMLACVISCSPPTIILWFRAEQVETVNWAGNPHKPVEPGSSPGQLTPRKSFETWVEAVQGRSRAWRANEQEAARGLASGLSEIRRHKALTELNRQLTSDIAEKDLLMREVHHRVQNSLQLVTSMLQLQAGEPGEPGVREQLELARDRVLSVAMLHRRLWRSQDLQSINLETFFNELIEGLMSTWGEEWQGRVTLDAEPVRVPAHDALLIALIVSELLTNAVKHAYSGAAGPLGVGVREIDKGHIAITIADEGVGWSGKEQHRSFGSRLVQRLVARMGGKLDVTANSPGTRVTMLVPRALTG
jgi:light-regulated signal transduction histidine kinase (bacteriophytochrome)